MDKTEQLGRLYHQLNIGDEIQRNNACNEILTLISQTIDPVEKDRLRQSIIYYLIDLGRVYDAEFIIEALQSSTNEDMQMASYFHRIEFLKKFVNDPVNVLFPASGNQYKCLPLWQKTKVTKLCQ